MDAPAPATRRISEQAFAAIADLARREAGLVLPPGKATMVQSRLRARLRATGLADIEAYSRFVTSDEGSEERRNMISALTTNVSRFFREPHHFELLSREVLPDLAARARAGERIRIWSAGCSSGQEPYSIAMTLLRAAPDLASRDVLILASDIDPRILETAKAGHYPRPAMAEIPADMRSDFCTKGPDDGQFGIAARVRQIVRFRELNLHRDWPMRNRFDVVFCRNVVIYFDPPTQASLWPRFHRALAPEGWLFLGHSERISDSAAPLFQSAGLTAYRPRHGAAAG